MSNIIQVVIADDISDILDGLGVVAKFKYLDEIVLIEHGWWLIGLYGDEMVMWCGLDEININYVNYTVDAVRDLIVMASDYDWPVD